MNRKPMPQSKVSVFLKKGSLTKYGNSKSSFSQDVKDGVQAVLKEKGDYVIKQAKENLYKDRSIATANLVQSITPKGIRSEGQKQSYVIEMAKYYQWVDQGRGARKSNIPGTPPLKDKIVEWMNAKGLFPVKQRKSIAFVIARKINKQGTKGNKFFSSVVDNEFKEALMAELSAAVRGAIEFNIVEK